MKLIIFDCDGVLVDSEALLVDIEMTFLNKHGLEFTTGAYIDQFMGIPMNDWLKKASAMLVERRGEALPEDFFKPLEMLITRKIESELQAVAGALDVIRSIETPKCVASSSSITGLKSKLVNTGLFELFSPYIYSTQLVTHGKPAPDLFLYAAQQLNAQPAHCVVVEDSANGVLAGKRAGMHVIGFTGGGHCPEDHASALLAKGADAIAADFSELSSLLK